VSSTQVGTEEELGELWTLGEQMDLVDEANSKLAVRQVVLTVMLSHGTLQEMGIRGIRLLARGRRVVLNIWSKQKENGQKILCIMGTELESTITESARKE
jgi:hypothetical protein